MLNLDLKHAETAIAAGRLDEAFALVRKPENRGTRRGQQLLTQLADALIERGHNHLASKRLAPAGSDAAKAIECAGQNTAAVELFDAVVVARQNDGRRQADGVAIVDEAQRYANAGQLSLAAKLVEHSEVESTIARRVTQKLNFQREASAVTLEQACRLLEQGQFESALCVLSDLAAKSSDVAALSGKIAEAAGPVADAVQADLESGRLDRAADRVRRVIKAADHSAAIAEQVEVMQRCCRVQGLVESGSYQQAQDQLGLLAKILPDAKWLLDASDAVGQAARAINAVRSGPLGLVKSPGDFTLPTPACELVTQGYVHPQGDEGFAIPAFASPVASPFAGTGQRFLLQIDGFGSVLLLTGAEIRIGAVSRSQFVDIPVGDGIRGEISIRRDEGDYLLKSDAPVEVNRRSTSRRLLEDGDRIAVGSRGRLVFRKPVSASSSAVIELTGASFPRPDLRYVGLFGDSLILGPSGWSHIGLREQVDSIVLFRTATGIAARSMRAGGESKALVIDEPVIVAERRIQLRNA